MKNTTVVFKNPAEKIQVCHLYDKRHAAAAAGGYLKALVPPPHVKTYA